MQCKHCESNHVHKRSIRVNTKGSFQRYQCTDCKGWFSVEVEPISVNVIPEPSTTKKFVITSCQNNTSVNEGFVSALNHYCKINSAQLLVIPILYRANEYDVVEYHIPDYVDYSLVKSKMKIHDEVCIMGSFNFLPTQVNPISGLESLSKGDTLIIPSPQLRMKSLAVSASRHPAILHTTGAISNPEYTNTKIGEKALFNHSYSAIIIEIDSDNDFHLRVLNGDDSGMFYDIGTKYNPDGTTEQENPVAIVTGDEHAIFACPEVEDATYTGHNSIVRTLKPKYAIRGDVLDCASISHHTRKNVIKNVGKSIFSTNRIEDELVATVDYILRTTYLEDHCVENIMVASNHNDHLTRWFEEIDIRTEPHNAKFYHKYMWKILDSLEQTPIGFTHINPFEQFCKDIGLKNTRFLKRDESFRVADVELSLHGDKGISGTRGSIEQFSKLCDKVVIGHSHTPNIIAGAYQVGTSSRLKLDYTSGPSSWMNSHCLVYNNGKRQLINIINGKWKA